MILTLPLDLGIIAVFVLACAGLGRRLQAASSLTAGADTLGDFLISTGIGLCAVSYLTFALGCLGLLYRSVFIFILLLILSLTRREIAGFYRGAGSFSFAGLSRSEKILIALLLLAVVFNLFFNYCPPTAEDETSTHLGIPVKWLAAHAIYTLQGTPAQFFPAGILTQYTFLAAVGSVQTARLFHYVSGLFCMTVLYLLARKFMGRQASLLAAAIFYTLPVVTSLSGVGNTDLGTLMFALLAVYAYFNWLAEKSCNRLLLAAVLTGAHAACKYSAFPLLLIFPLLVLYEERRRLALAVKQAAAFALVSFSVLSPYLLRNAFITGNPLYPKRFFNFPYYEAMYFTYFKKEAFSDFLGKLGNLSAGGVIWGIGPLFAAFLPLIFVFRVRDGAGRNVSLRLFVVAALYYLLLFAAGISFQLSRHSLLSYALLSIPIAGAVSQLYSGSRLRGYIGSLLALSFLTNLCLPLYFGGERLPVFLGFESAQAYFDRKYTIWEKSFFVEYINGRIPEGAGILFVNCQAPELHYPRHRIFCMDLFDKYFYRVTPSAAVVELDKYGIEYFVVAGSSVNRSDSGMVYYTGPDGETPIRWFPAASGELLVTHDNVSLYKRVKTVGTTPENKYLKTL